MRRGTYFVPKYMFGRPMDGIINFCEKIPMPRWLRNRLYTHWHRLMVGKNERYGLPEPEHRIMDTHPTMNTVLPQLAGHGRIGVKPDITEFAGNRVRFSDGSEVEADIVVFATGYEISIPFMDNTLLFGSDGQPLLYLNVFHPELDDLFAVGLIQANGSIWRLADDQSQLVASYLIAQAERHERAELVQGAQETGPPEHGARLLREERPPQARGELLRLPPRAEAASRRFGAMAKCDAEIGPADAGA